MQRIDELKFNPPLRPTPHHSILPLAVHLVQGVRSWRMIRSREQSPASTSIGRGVQHQALRSIASTTPTTTCLRLYPRLRTFPTLLGSCFFFALPPTYTRPYHAEQKHSFSYPQCKIQLLTLDFFAPCGPNFYRPGSSFDRHQVFLHGLSGNIIFSSIGGGHFCTRFPTTGEWSNVFQWNKLR